MLIEQCTESDVYGHYEAIRSNVSDSDEIVFKDRMLMCVKSGTAFCVPDTCCFIYYLPRTVTTADGIAFNGHCNPTVTLKMLCLVFSGRRIRFIDFLPHDGVIKGVYKSLLGGSKPKGLLRVDVGRILDVVKNKTMMKVPHE